MEYGLSCFKHLNLSILCPLGITIEEWPCVFWLSGSGWERKLPALLDLTILPLGEN